MPNTFITPTIVGREALMILKNNLVMASLVSRGHQAEIAGAKVGDTIKVRVPAVFTAQSFTGTTTYQDATESSVNLVLEKHFDVSFKLTSKELTLSLVDFSAQLIEPAMVAVAQAIDAYILEKFVEVYSFVGTVADPPDTWAEVVAVEKKFNDLMIPMVLRRAVTDTQARADLLTLAEFHEADKRGDGGLALLRAQMGMVLGIEWFMDQNVKTHTPGTFDTSGVLINGAVAAGAKTMNLDTGGATGTIVVGDVFTVASGVNAGFQGAFTNATTAVAGAITGATFEPAAPTGGFADNANVDIVGSGASPTAYKANLAFHPNAITLAMVPLEKPRGAAAAEFVTDPDTGASVRVVFDYEASSQSDTVNIGVLVGAKVQQPSLAFRILG